MGKCKLSNARITHQTKVGIEVQGTRALLLSKFIMRTFYLRLPHNDNNIPIYIINIFKIMSIFRIGYRQEAPKLNLEKVMQNAL